MTHDLSGELTPGMRTAGEGVAREEPVEPNEPPAERPRSGRRRASGRPPGRAGRNLPAAIGVGVVLGAIVLSSLFFWRPAFLGVLVAAIAVGTWEMTRAVAQRAHPPTVPVLAGGLVMAALAWYGGADGLLLGLLATVLATFVWRLGDGPAGYQRDVMAGALIAVYVPFLGGFAALLARSADGDVRVLATLLAVVLSDTGGYVTGVFFGKHPMAPSVSPKKSWEGFAGSLLWTAAGSAVALHFLIDGAGWWQGVIFGLAVSGASVLGDLGESLIKRDLGVKDMSNLLPGHGGLMDRLDSILLAAPTAYAVLALLLPPK
jgi:phosphatidate cytidylyltransferase